MPPVPALVVAIGEQYAAAVEAQEGGAVLQMYNQYRDAINSTRVQLDLLTQAIQARQDAGLDVTPGWLLQQERWRQTIAHIQLEQQRLYAGNLDVVQQLARQATELAAQKALEEVDALAGADISTDFSRPFFKAAEHVQAQTQRGPVAEAIAAAIRDQGYDAVREMSKTMVRSIILGWNPDQIARQFTRIHGGQFARTRTIMRTEQFRAYRAANQAMYQQTPVVQGWVWNAHLGRRTCPVCWAMHGKYHAKTETMGSHPNCRCAMLPRTSPWATVNYDLVTTPDLAEQIPIEPGWKQFANLSPDDQLSILGPARYDRFKNGQLTLDQMVQEEQDRTWGTTRRLRSISDLDAPPPVPPPVRKAKKAAVGTAGGDAPPAKAPRKPAEFAKVPGGHEDLGGPEKYARFVEKERMPWQLSTPQERVAWDAYKTESDDMNGLLRGTLKKPLTEARQSDMLRYVEGLDGALDRAVLPRGVKVYRGINSVELRGTLKKGSEFVDHGFISTTGDIDRMEDFAAGFTGLQKEGAILAEIRVPKGYRAGFFDRYGTGDWESEVLLPRGTRFRVISTKVDAGGRMHAVLEVVEQPRGFNAVTQKDLDDLDALLSGKYAGKVKTPDVPAPTPHRTLPRREPPPKPAPRPAPRATTPAPTHPPATPRSEWPAGVQVRRERFTKQQADEIEQVVGRHLAKYPALGKVRTKPHPNAPTRPVLDIGIDSDGVAGSNLAVAHTIQVRVNPNVLGNLNATVKRGREEGWLHHAHAHTTGMESTITHELGHVVEHKLDQYGSDLFDPIRELLKKGDPTGISKYAATNRQEMFAEIWAEYQLDPHPSPYVTEVGRAVEDALERADREWYTQ